MSELRSDATQAIAQALWSKVQDEYDDEWADIALDALLTFLEAHTEEWDRAAERVWRAEGQPVGQAPKVSVYALRPDCPNCGGPPHWSVCDPDTGPRVSSTFSSTLRAVVDP